MGREPEPETTTKKNPQTEILEPKYMSANENCLELNNQLEMATSTCPVP
jgi:hypothetical protein